MLHKLLLLMVSYISPNTFQYQPALHIALRAITTALDHHAACSTYLTELGRQLCVRTCEFCSNDNAKLYYSSSKAARRKGNQIGESFGSEKQPGLYPTQILQTITDPSHLPVRQINKRKKWYHRYVGREGSQALMNHHAHASSGKILAKCFSQIQPTVFVGSS